MNLAFLLGRVVRRLVSPVRTPRGWPVRVERLEPVPFEQRFPRVPPTFMTASEHAVWLHNEAVASADARWREQVAWARSGLACSRPEMNAELVRGQLAAQQGPVPWDSLSAEQQRAWQRARAEAGINTCVPHLQRNWCAGHRCELVECWARGRSS